MKDPKDFRSMDDSPLNDGSDYNDPYEFFWYEERPKKTDRWPDEEELENTNELEYE
jgi:hypothetical protein